MSQPELMRGPTGGQLSDSSRQQALSDFLRREQPLANVVDHKIIDGAGLAVLLKHPADAGRPADQVPASEALIRPEEDVAGEDPPVLAVTDASRLCSRRHRKLRSVAVDPVDAQEFADLRLAIWGSVQHVPHTIRTLRGMQNVRVRARRSAGYRMLTGRGTTRSRGTAILITESAKSELGLDCAGRCPG